MLKYIQMEHAEGILGQAVGEWFYVMKIPKKLFEEVRGKLPITVWS